MQASVEILLQDSRIWRGSDWQLTARPGLPSGFGELDALLPGHGWPRGSVIELQHDSHGQGEVRLLWPALAQLTAQSREVALVNPPWLPYAPAWRAAGVDLHQLLWLRSNGDEQRLWAFEQCLRSGACGGALLWLEREPDRRSWRRLQLAAEEGDCTGWVLLRSAQVRQTSPVTLRLRLFQQRGAQLQILKRRGPPLLQALPLSQLDIAVGQFADPRHPPPAGLRQVWCRQD